MLEDAQVLKRTRSRRRDRVRRDLRTKRYRGADRGPRGRAPQRRVQYRGVEMEEMDVEAILARKPQVAIVDELAHSNVPGSTNEKRYRDVDELLDAGIHVMTAVNIQHLETLNDAVAPGDRSAGERDRSRHVPRPRRRGGQRRRHGRGAQDETPAGQNLPPRESGAGALATSSARETYRPSASSRSGPSPTRSGRRRRAYRAREGLEPALIPERVMVGMSSNARPSASSEPAPGSRDASARAGTRSMSRRPGESVGRIRPKDADALGTEHRARREPRGHGGPGESRSVGRRAHRVRPA